MCAGTFYESFYTWIYENVYICGLLDFQTLDQRVSYELQNRNKEGLFIKEDLGTLTKFKFIDFSIDLC